ncbi:MAG: helix-turn-helix transcriptional regulator [Marinobacter sp.]|uniref:helix-turn-helix domain-containing protein n=1 Tax=Marinobacter sp. TaxID=50741 RepID=UPI003296C3D1
MSLTALKKEAFKNEAVREEYDRLAGEFEFIDQLITMRSNAGLTQDELAKRIGTAKSNISRLERGRSNPSWGTLKKYAMACGYRVKLEAVEDKNTVNA